MYDRVSTATSPTTDGATGRPRGQQPLSPRDMHQQHSNKVQHVYSFDVEALSDRLGLSQQELVDGMAKDLDHVALKEMLNEDDADVDADSSSDDDDDDADDNDDICRHACLLLPSTMSLDSNISRSFTPLVSLADGHSVLEHTLHELFQPNVVTHLVVCIPASVSASGLRPAVTKIASRLAAGTHVRVEFVDLDHADSDVHAVQRAAQYLANSSSSSTTRSRSLHRDRNDGLLVLSCDRIFDAPTIRMMAVSTRAATEPASGAASTAAKVRVRALVDLDVELIAEAVNSPCGADNNEISGAATHCAGIVAFVGDAAATLEVLEQAAGMHASRSLPSLVASLTAASAADASAHGALAVVEKVVASDYCSWQRTAKSDSNAGSRAGPIVHHSASAFYQPTKDNNNNNNDNNDNKSSSTNRRSSKATSDARRDSASPLSEPQTQCESFEHPRREPQLLASHGYEGYRINTKVFTARAPERTESGGSHVDQRQRQQQQHQRVGECTSETMPLLTTASSERATEATTATTTTATTLTDLAELSALLDAQNRAFLFQIGSDALPQLSSSSSSAERRRSRTSSGEEYVSLSALRAPRYGDSGRVFLALPDVTRRRSSRAVAFGTTQVATDPFASLNKQSPSQSRRRFSALPSAVKEVTVEATVQPSSAATSSVSTTTSAVAVNVVVKTQVPIVGYVILVIALVAISSQGAAQDLLVGVPPLLKVFWRMTGASLAFAPLALHSLAANNWRLPALAPRKRLLFALCAVAYSVYSSTFIVALSLTSVGHTYIFSNCHSLLLVLAKVVLGQPLGVLELAGAAIGFSGGVLTTMDRSHSASSARHGPSTLGDMVALGGAFAGVAYLLSAKRVRPTMGVFLFMWTLVTTVAVLVLVVLLASPPTAIGGAIVASTDSRVGLAGWTRHIGIELYVVLIGSFAGTMGFITSLKYFDPLVVSVTMLTEPVVATIIGICLGVDQVPGLFTFLGGFAVCIGCALVLLASHRTCTRVNVSDALEEPAAVAQQMLLQSRNGGDGKRRHSMFHPHIKSQAQPMPQPTQAQQSSLFHVHYGSFP